LLRRFFFTGRAFAPRAVALFALAAGAAAADAPASRPVSRLDFTNPPPGLFLDDWFEARLMGKKAGHLHSTVERREERIISTLEMHFALQRGEVEVELSVRQRFRETLDGRPLGFEHELRLAGQPIRQKGVIRGARLTLTTEQFGATTKQTYAFDAETKFSWGQLLEQRRRGLKTGTRYRFKTYDPSVAVDRAIDADVEVLGPERVPVGGRPTRAIRTRMITNLAVPVTSETWVDEDGLPLISSVKLGAIEMEIVRTDRESALAGGRGPEMLFSTLISVRGEFDRRARRVVYRLRIGGDEEMPDLPTTGMQTWKRLGQNEIEIAVSRIDWDAVRRPAARPDEIPADISETFLQASTYLDINDPGVRRLARRGARGAEGPAELADGLRRFVTDYVEDKGLDVGFATASEVAKTRKGDCTEHGVLLAALARARGLPARVVAGIVMVPQADPDDDPPRRPLDARENTKRRLRPAQFGYHMWTQVYLDGRWIDLDSALRQTECDATHIALAALPLNTEGIFEGTVKIVPLLGRLEIEFVRAEP